MPIAIDHDAAEVKIADLNVYLQDPQSEAGLAECREVAESLIVSRSRSSLDIVPLIPFQLTGALIVKDTRADASFNDRFLDLLETYFAQDRAALEKDLRPELGYQVVSPPLPRTALHINSSLHLRASPSKTLNAPHASPPPNA
jgi:hypothetical protein